LSKKEHLHFALLGSFIPLVPDSLVPMNGRERWRVVAGLGEKGVGKLMQPIVNSPTHHETLVPSLLPNNNKLLTAPGSYPALSPRMDKMKD